MYHMLIVAFLLVLTLHRRATLRERLPCWISYGTDTFR